MYKYETFYTKFIKNYKINGKDMICICPFHNDNETPSLHIDLIKGGFHCFGCEAHGNAREFLKKLEEINTNINFIAQEQTNIKITTMFDNTLYAEKPKGEEIGKIKNRIETQLAIQEYTLENFISNFAKGITIIPAGIKGNAEANWKEQQVFLLDFDNKDLQKYASVNLILEYCKQINLIPTCIYHTFSSTEKLNKFRLVYVFKHPITDYKLAQKIIAELFDKFKQFNPDTSKRNLADMFFGGKSIAFNSKIVYTAEVQKNINISNEDFYNLPAEKLDHTEIAEILMTENNIKLFNEDIYIYNNGVYNNSQKILEQKILEIYKKAPKRTREEVISYLKIKLENKYKEVDKNYINFLNGLYDIKNNKLISHTADIFTINQLPICYRQHAPKHEKMEKFLNNISCFRHRKEAILQIIGYCMTNSIEFQKAFIFYGQTAENGKSTLLEIICKLIGIENVCHVSIHSLQDKFYASELKNKLLNAVPELSNIALRTAEIFKAVITGDRISTEKKFRDREEAKTYAKHVFTTNEIPKIAHADNGFYRRLNILLFEAIFTEEEKAKFNIEEILTKEALEYLALISLQAYQRLLKIRKFANEEESNKVLRIYKLENNSALAFFADTKNITRLKKQYNNLIPLSILNEEYKRWCKRNGYVILGRNTFYAEIDTMEEVKRIKKDNTDYLLFLEEDFGF